MILVQEKTSRRPVPQPLPMREKKNNRKEKKS